MKCSSGHLNAVLTNLPKNSMEKNWKYFALNPTNFEKLQTLWKTEVSHQNGKKRFSFVDAESSSYTRAGTVSQKTWQLFNQNPKNLTKQHCTQINISPKNVFSTGRMQFCRNCRKLSDNCSRFFNKHPLILSISKLFFPSEIFPQIIHLGTLNAALTTLPKVRWTKLMRFCYESVKSWRFTKTFKTKVFARKFELTIFSTLGTWKAVCSFVPETVSPKLWESAPNVKKSY